MGRNNNRKKETVDLRVPYETGDLGFVINLEHTPARVHVYGKAL